MCIKALLAAKYHKTKNHKRQVPPPRTDGPPGFVAIQLAEAATREHSNHVKRASEIILMEKVHAR
jgi:hypothetical protein